MTDGEPRADATGWVVPEAPPDWPASEGRNGAAPPPTSDGPTDAPAAVPEPGPAIEVATTRRLLAVAFELLSRTNEDMRRTSFYVGAVVLGTVGPLALASLALGAVAVERTPDDLQALIEGDLSGPIALLGILALAGIVVAAVESRTLAAAILGSSMAGRPIDARRALVRSRHVFWRAVAASIVVAVPLVIAQAIVAAMVDPSLGSAEAAVVTQAVVTAVVGAPFVYVLAGVVLGDVDPLDAVRRSFRVFRARRAAAVLIAAFESVALLLIFLGATTGLDLALRLLAVLGLGLDSGPAGLAVLTAVLVAAVFAFGTLIYTVIAITVAPQVVMFVGLTHATMGLDHVLPGGRDDPHGPGTPPARPVRTFSRPMLAGFATGGLLLALAIGRLAG